MRHLYKTFLRTFLVFFFIASALATYAQQLHFIYIQADNKQPFSVKLNGKYYSSSSIGYIILPKLTDGTYNLEINFAKNSYPEQTFTVTVAGKDYGYALKNFDEKGWGLFNFQTTDVVMNNAPSAQNNETNTVTNNSAFGNMLAEVINDKSINTLSAADTVTTVDKDNKPLAKEDHTATAASNLPDTSKAAATIIATAAPDTVSNTDSVTSNITQNADVAIATDTINATTAEDTLAEGETPEFNTTGVIKAEENVDDKGTDLTFIDFNGNRNDTIKAFIPAEGKKMPAKKDTANVNAKTSAAGTVKSKVDNPFFVQHNTKDSTTTPAAKPNLIEDDQPTTALSKNALINSTCTNMVNESDLNKLKKRIVSQTSQDEILETVKKSLRNKCITTAQVKDLGNLFLNDDNRYGFYDAVYPYVYDYGSYASLESTLIAQQYKTRFKTLLR